MTSPRFRQDYDYDSDDLDLDALPLRHRHRILARPSAVIRRPGVMSPPKGTRRKTGGPDPVDPEQDESL